MFPEIGTNSKKDNIGTYSMKRQTEQIIKQLSIKVELIIKKFSNQKVIQFNKICLLKEIPLFYSQNFIFAVHKKSLPELKVALENEADSIISKNSYYHQITQLIEKITLLHTAVRTLLSLIEGLYEVKNGKKLTKTKKQQINKLIQPCKTFQQLKQMENDKMKQLVDLIEQVRNCTGQLLLKNLEWRQQLVNLQRQSQHMEQNKIIFPYRGINCMLIPLYNFEYVRQSFLKEEINFTKEQYDPFLLNVTAKKKTSESFNILIKGINQNTNIHYQFMRIIEQEIPNYRRNKPQTANKVIDTENKKQFMKTDLQINHRKINYLHKIIDIDNITKKSNQKKNQFNNFLKFRNEQKIIKFKKTNQSNKKINKVNSMSNLSSSRYQNTSIDQKILKIYKNKKPRLKTLVDETKIQQLLNIKQNLQKQLDQQRKEKKQIIKFIKKQDKQFKTKIKNRKLNPYEVKKQSIKSINSERKQSLTSSIERIQTKLINQQWDKKKLTKRLKQIDQEKNKLEEQVKKQRQNNEKLQLTDQQKKNHLSQEIRQKQRLQKQIQKLNRQHYKSEKILKMIERKTQSELNKYQLKQSKYKQKIQKLQKQLKNQKSIDIKQKDKKQLIRNIYNKKQKNMKFSKIKRSLSLSSQIEKTPKENYYQTQLENEKKKSIYMEKQLIDLNREKNKLEHLINTSQDKINKEREIYKKQLQQYSNAIEKLKSKTNLNSNVMQRFQKNKQTKKKNHVILDMYTSVPTKQNNNNSKQIKLQPKKQISEQKNENISPKKNKKQVQIIKTNKTIQIILKSQNNLERKQIIKDIKKDLISKKDNQALVHLQKLQKQKHILQKKLKREMNFKSKDKSLENTINQQQTQLERYHKLLQNEKQQRQSICNSIKSMKSQLIKNYQIKMIKQKNKFKNQKTKLINQIQAYQREKQIKRNQSEAIKKIENETKQRQRELIDLIYQERKQRKEQQKFLIRQVQKRQQLLNLMQLEQVKNNIEQQMRKRMFQQTEKNQVQDDIKKQQQQIEQYLQFSRDRKEEELKQIEEENEKIQELIEKIKNEENEVMNSIKVNVTQEKQFYAIHETTSEKYNQIKQNHEESSDKNHYHQKIETEEIMRQLKQKTNRQLQSERKTTLNYQQILTSPQYRQKEKVENLIEYYLNQAHSYPQQGSNKFTQKEKQQVIKDVLIKNQKVHQFQKQLQSLKKLQHFIPDEKNDLLSTHLIELRQAYNNEQAQTLKRQLFPVLHESQFNDEDQLSVEYQKLPVPISIMDHVKIHSKKYSPKKHQSKNFLAINRMKVIFSGREKRKKQRLIIQQQSQIRTEKMKVAKNRKQRAIKLKQRKLQKQKQKSNKKQSTKQKIIQDKINSPQKKQNGQIEQKDKKQKQIILKQNENEVKKQYIEDQNQEDKEIDLIDDEEEQKQNIEQGQKQQTNKQNQILQQQTKKNGQNQAQLNKIQELQQIDIEQSYMDTMKAKLQSDRMLLQEDISSYRNEVRSYISSQQSYNIYQQFVSESQLNNYIDNLLELSSQEIKTLNGTANIKKIIHQVNSILILIAKNDRGIQIGIGLFHRRQRTYHCEYLLTHKMENILSMTFNFSNYIFKEDKQVNQVQYLFDLQDIKDEINLLHFQQFQTKCKRMGQVYVNMKSNKCRKYILKRNLFTSEIINSSIDNMGEGQIKFSNNLLIHNHLMKQKGQGYINKTSHQNRSNTLLLAYYLWKNNQEFNQFKQKTEEDLNYRELLLTTLILQKKVPEIKNLSTNTLDLLQSKQLINSLSSQFHILDEKYNINTIKFQVKEQLPNTIKRCILEIQIEDIPYLCIQLEQPVSEIQSSNSSERGLFISLIPKYKILIIPSIEYQRMSKQNPHLNVYFYVRHFIKNITDVKKQQYKRIYLPQLHLIDTTYYSDTSDKLRSGVFLQTNVVLGWNGLPSSVIFNPTHKDLIMQKPFIISLLSANLERITEGTPIWSSLIE